MITTDIVIVSFNDKPQLDVCVTSIKEHCQDYNLIIEDNNPPLPNRGFTLAVNEGTSKGTAPYIWYLNSDAVVMKNTQQALIDRFGYHEKVGIVGSMQIDPQNPDRIAFGGVQRCFPSGIHKGGFISMGHCQIPEKQTWVNGASMMVRRKMHNEVGPLDNNMFLLYSDSDYCYVCRKAGWDVWYEPKSVVSHTLGKASKNSQEIAQNDMIAFMKKWDITTDGKGNFFYSREFALLDALP